MNKAILVVVGVVIVGGGAWYLMKGMPKQSETSPTPNAETNREAGSGLATGKRSLKSLATSSTPQKCTFDETVANSSSSGTIYIAGGKMRGDFTSMSSGQTVMSHMIVMDGTSYVWSDAMVSGIKMSFTGTQSANSGQAVNPDKELDYTCQPWSPDPGMLSLPSGVTFTDIKAMMQ